MYTETYRLVGNMYASFVGSYLFDPYGDQENFRYNFVRGYAEQDIRRYFGTELNQIEYDHNSVYVLDLSLELL